MNPLDHQTQDQPRRDQGSRLGDDVRAEPASQGGGELPTHRGETDMWDSNKTPTVKKTEIPTYKAIHVKCEFNITVYQNLKCLPSS